MANKDAPFGFIPVRMIGGAYFSGGQSEYDILSTYGTNMFRFAPATSVLRKPWFRYGLARGGFF